MKPGKVSNINELNQDLLWFNGTNSVQLQVEIRAGKEPGTSDYYITAYEPKKHVFSVFADNSGFKSSGVWRAGAGYTNRSLTGNRDELSLTSLYARGSLSGGISYNIPITHKGTRLGVNYNANKVKIIDGVLSDLEVKGHSESYGVNLTQPLWISKTNQIELFSEWRQQKSQTDILGFDWVDDKIDNYSAGLSFTHYRNNLVIYHRYSYGFGQWTDILDQKKEYNKYSFMGIVQKGFSNNHLLTFKANAQLTSDHFLPSSDQFYIGGAHSVRGYKENFLGADNGVSASLEYMIPIKKKWQTFAFTDFGTVFGDNAFDDKTLYSAGVGGRWYFSRQGVATMTLGVPLQRNYNGETTGSAQIHFAASKQF